MSLQLYSQPLPASSLIVGPVSLWTNLSTELNNQTHPADRWQVESEKGLTIAEVRKLQHFAAQSPVASHKLAILTGVDQFKLETANALLKLLEEPPAYLYLVLMAESDHILPTVHSRLTRLSIPQDSATLTLTPISELEKWQVAFQKYNLQESTARSEAKRLLYLQALAHSGIKSELLVEPFLNSVS